MKWRLLLSLISGIALALLASVCLHGVASLQERHALEPATALLQASARAIEAELNLRGRTLGELAEEVAGDPDLPGELEALGGRADHRIGQFRGVRPDVDVMTLMNHEGVVVGTNAPGRHVGDSLVARGAAAAPAKAPAPHTPGQLDAVLAGYPARGVSSIDGALYHWGAAPVRVKNEVVGALLLERRLQALPAFEGTSAFLVVDRRVVLGAVQEGWRNFVVAGPDKPFLMLPKDAAGPPFGKRPMFVDLDRIGVWAQRFHVPGSSAPVGFVTIDVTPAFAELASFQLMLMILAGLVWLAHATLLMTTNRLAPEGAEAPAESQSGLPPAGAQAPLDRLRAVLEHRVRPWFERLAGRGPALLARLRGAQAGLPGEQPARPPASPESATIIDSPAHLAGGAAATGDGDKDRTPPLGVHVPSALPGIIDEAPPPAGTPAPPSVEAAHDFFDEDMTSTVPMTPELMAELGYQEPPEHDAFETRVMNLTPEMMADMKGAAAAAAAAAEPGTTEAPEPGAAAASSEPGAAAAPPEPGAAAASEPGAAEAAPEPGAAAASPEAPPAPPEEDPVYREVFTRYIVMRKMCGQPADMPFDSFKEDLEKAQAQVIARNNCTRVRFHVVIRDGKAILATTPIP